jgi:predicted ferric reductase
MPFQSLHFVLYSWDRLQEKVKFSYCCREWEEDVESC